MTRYRWLSKAEARRRFPDSPKLWGDVTDQNIKGVVSWAPDEWAAAMLATIADPACTRAVAQRYRLAEEAMRVCECPCPCHFGGWDGAGTCKQPCDMCRCANTGVKANVPDGD